MASSSGAKSTKNLLTDRERAIIHETAKTAFAVGLIQSETRSKDAYKATEQRLYNLPVLRAKIENDRERLIELQTQGSSVQSASIVRFKRSGSRISPEDALDALIQDIKATTTANEYEVSQIEKALSIIEADQYFIIVPCLYFNGMTAEETCIEAHCERSTVFRQRMRLVQRLAVFLYGTDAT